MKACTPIIASTIVLTNSFHFTDAAFTIEVHGHDSEKHDAACNSKPSYTVMLVGAAGLIMSLLIVSKTIPVGKYLETYPVLVLSFDDRTAHILGPTHYILVTRLAEASLVSVLIRQVVSKKEKMEVII